MIGMFAMLMTGSSQAAVVDYAVVHSGFSHEALFAIALEKDRGLAVGMPSLVLATNDGGQSWTPQAIDNGGLALLGVAMTPDHAIVVGQMGRIFTRTAEGAWEKAESNTQERLLSVSMNAQGQAIVSGAFGTLLFSQDNGATWKNISPDWMTLLANDGEEPHINAVSISADGSITAVGEFGLILRSADKGASWQILSRGDAALFGLYLDHQGRGAAVGQNGTVMISDGWHSPWRKVETGRDENLLDVWVDQTGRMTVTGIRALLTSTDGGASWSENKTKDIATGWYQGVAARDETSGAPLAVGYDARILKIGF